MKCKHCNSENPNDSLFCEQCGNRLNLMHKHAVTCDISLVKWLLYSMMFVLCASNLLVGFHFDVVSNSIDSVVFLWWIIPLLSLIISVVSLVLTKKKKLSVVFTIVMFLLFGANTAEMALGIAYLQEEEYESLGVIVTPHGGNSFCLEPAWFDCEHSRYSSYEEAYQAIDKMGIPHELSCKGCDIQIGPHTIRGYCTGNTQRTVAVVTIVEGFILVLYLVFNAIFEPTGNRKERN